MIIFRTEINNLCAVGATIIKVPLRRPYVAKKAFCSAYVSAMYFIVVLLLYVLVLLFA